MNFYEYNASRVIPENLGDSIVDSDHNVIKEINNLSKINIIVGPNNSGKSYIMRELFKEPTEPIYLSLENLNKINNDLQEYIDIFHEIIRPEIPPEMFDILPQVVMRQKLNEGDFDLDEHFDIGKIDKWLEVKNCNNIIDVFKDVKALKKTIGISEKQSLKIARDFTLSKSVSQKLYEWITKVENEVEEWNNNYVCKDIKYKQIYIHYFRSIWSYTLNASNLHLAIYEAYSFPGRGRNTPSDRLDTLPLFDGWIMETGMDLYDSIDRMNGRVILLTKFAQFQTFLSQYFFEDKGIVITPGKEVPVQTFSNIPGKENQRSDKNVREFEIQIGNEAPLAIHNLGTGIQMMIILTWFMFEFDTGVVFIEEPELFVHPGMQKQLMDIYDRHPRSKNFQFFITTHSNHIIDYAQYSSNVGMISINKIVVDKDKQDAETKFMLTQHEKVELELLNSLGVTNSSLFISNCTIWVEGITDYEYLSKFLELYQYTKPFDERYKIDLHFGFLEYGGSLIEHWMFKDEKLSPEEKSKAKKQIRAKNISNRILVISDQDENKDGKHQRLTQELGEDYYFLPCREIENILSPQIIVSIVEKIEKKTLPHLEKAIVGMGALGKLSELIAINLHEIIKDETTGETQLIKYFAESQGKRGKRTFCSKAISIIDKKIESLNLIKDNRVLKREELNEVMRDYTWKVCDKMYNFITKHNS